MKVSVCVDNNKWAIPYSEEDKVGDILEIAVNRYMKHISKSQNMDEVLGACHLLTSDGAILYNDDKLCDVIDSNDTIKVAFRDDVNFAENFPVEVPRFNKVPSKLALLQFPPIPPFQNKSSTGPRHKSMISSKTPDRLKSREEIVASFSRMGGRKSLGSNVFYDAWFEARYKLQGRQGLEMLHDSNNINSSSHSLLDSCLQANNDNMLTSKHSQSDLTNLIPSNHSSSLLAINQSSTTLPSGSPTSKGLRPRSAAVKGYMTEFRGREVNTKRLEPAKEGIDEVQMNCGSDSSSSKKMKNQSTAVLAPSNTRVIGKMLSIELVKGTSGLGFTITSRDNMADMNSPVYIKNILPGGAAQLDGKLKILDRLLAVNGMDVSNAKQTEVTQLLRQIPIGQGVELLISRQVEDENNKVRNATRENLPASSEALEDFRHHGDDELHASYDTNSPRQPSMTKEMEKFLDSSVSPPYHNLNNHWDVPLKQLLPHANCNLRPLINEGKVVVMLIQASPSSPELQLLEIDGQLLTPDLTVPQSIDLIKKAINKAWYQEGSNVIARVRKPLGFFDSYGNQEDSKLADIHHDQEDRLVPSTQSLKSRKSRFQEATNSQSKSAPTTPIAIKQEMLTSVSDMTEVSEREAERDYEEGQEGSTFDRKGFGRQSMSEKRKGRIDPRSLDFYRQMKNEKIGGGTSYATWDTRKTSRLKKLAANANLKNISGTSSSSIGDKQYKSMENLSANQNGLVNEHPVAVQAGDLDITDKKQGEINKIDESKAVKGDGNQPVGGDNNDYQSQVRSGKRNTRICRDKKSRSAIAQEHKKFISKMRQAVENLRLSPKIDSPFATSLTSPTVDIQTSIIAKLPPRPLLKSDALTKDDNDRSGSSIVTPHQEKDFEKINPASALKFAFRSLPKKFNKTSWPFMSKVKGEGSTDGVPIGRLQPEGKEEGPMMIHGNLTHAMDPHFRPKSSSSPSRPQHKTLAHIPVLKVKETSNIYKDIAEQQHLKEGLSWQQQNRHDPQSPPWSREQTTMCDWHPQQRSPLVHCHHHHHDQSYNYDYNHHHHHVTPSNHDAHGNLQTHHQQHYMSPQYENIDQPRVMHRCQRSYDGSTLSPPSSRTLTTVSLKMKPYEGWYSQGISGSDCKGCTVYTPEMQYKACVGSKGSPKYVTTLKVNCDEEVGNSINSPDENAFGFHLVQPTQNFHKDVAWTRSARV